MAVRAPALSNTQPAVAIKINSKPNQNAPHERPGRQVAAPCRWRQEAIPGTRMTSRKSAALGARTRPSGDLVLSVVGHRGPPVAPLDSPRARIALAAPDIATSWRRSGLVTSSAPRWSSPLAVGVTFCLHRAESLYEFTPAEVRITGRLAASLGNGCRLSLAAPGDEGSRPSLPVSSFLHPDRTLGAITGEAEHLLAQNGRRQGFPPVIKVHRNAALSENAAQMILLTVVWGTGMPRRAHPSPRVPRPLPQLILSY
jgi:hypothetical protein